LGDLRNFAGFAGRVYLQAVVDTYGSYAFGKLYTSKIPETAADILYDRVLPFYEEQGLIVEHILTDLRKAGDPSLPDIRGYRNMGRRPIETIEEGKKVKAQRAEQVA
jgi:hypothetical protein